VAVVLAVVDQIVEIWIEIPGLRPELVRWSTGEIVGSDNLQERILELRDAIRTRPWLKDLWRDIRRGERTATVVVALGGLRVVTASAPEFRFGIQGSRDIHDIVRRFKHARRMARFPNGRITPPVGDFG
jgi:hypothetical protein